MASRDCTAPPRRQRESRQFRDDAAMFMEDEVLPDTTLDDTVSRMEAALAAAKGEAAVEEKVEEKPASSIDDGWRRVLCSVCFFAWRAVLVVDLARALRKTRQLAGRCCSRAALRTRGSVVVTKRFWH